MSVEEYILEAGIQHEGIPLGVQLIRAREEIPQGPEWAPIRSALDSALGDGQPAIEGEPSI